MSSDKTNNEESLSRQLAIADANIEKLKRMLVEQVVKATALEVCAELGEVAPLVANLVAEKLNAVIDDRGVRVVAVDDKGNPRTVNTSVGPAPLTARDVFREVKKTAVVRHLLGEDTGGESSKSSSNDASNLTEKSLRIARNRKEAESKELSDLKRICRAANPFSPAHRNLTLATRVAQLDPAYAQKLQREAAA